jgi:hypothetical protein
MKANLLLVVSFVIASAAFGQGTINFNNRQVGDGTGAQAPVVAPIFGIDPNCPPSQKSGLPDQTWYNGATVGGSNGPLLTDGLGHSGTPGLTYGGALLVGTGFTAGLWALPSNNPDSAFNDPNLLPVATALFGPKTSTGLALRGYWNPPATAVAVPGVVGGANDPTRIKFQVRVWDNAGGTVTTWAQVIANNSGGRGLSPVIFLDQPLGSGTTLPPNLLGLQSFQFFLTGGNCIPVPSVIGLGALGVACLLLRRGLKMRC